MPVVRPSAFTGRPPGLQGSRRGLPVLVHGVSTHAQVLRLRDVTRWLTLCATRCVAFLAVALSRHVRIAGFRSSIARPAYTPVNASAATLRPPPHDSGPGWCVTPFPYDSFIHYSMPVYPGAFATLPRSRSRTRLGTSHTPLRVFREGHSASIPSRSGSPGYTRERLRGSVALPDTGLLGNDPSRATRSPFLYNTRCAIATKNAPPKPVGSRVQILPD
jgi:hypothetical protein